MGVVISMVPASGSRHPVRILRRVVLPEPFSPRRSMTSPARISPEMLLSTVCPPKALVRLSKRRRGAEAVECKGMEEARVVGLQRKREYSESRRRGRRFLWMSGEDFEDGEVGGIEGVDFVDAGTMPGGSDEGIEKAFASKLVFGEPCEPLLADSGVLA